MARIRTLKPEVWLSPQVMNLLHSARLLFVGLITQADDDGRGSADSRRLKAAIFPGDDVTVADVSEWLAQVVEQGLALVYDGGTHGLLYELPSWSVHQKISHPVRSRYPGPNGKSPPPEVSRKLQKNPEDSVRTPVGSTRARIGSEGSEGSDPTRTRAREGALREVGEAAEAWVKGVA